MPTKMWRLLSSSSGFRQERKVLEADVCGVERLARSISSVAH
jgi:hypothetical protein